jgi:hypothetical protein
MWLVALKYRSGVIKVTRRPSNFDARADLAGHLRRPELLLRDLMRHHDLKVLSAKVSLESARWTRKGRLLIGEPKRGSGPRRRQRRSEDYIKEIST